MAEKSGAGKVLFGVVLGVIGTVLTYFIITTFWWLIVLALIIGAVVGVVALVRSGRRSLSGGRDRGQLPY